MAQSNSRRHPTTSRLLATEGDLAVLGDGTEWAVVDVTSSKDPTQYELRDLTRGCTLVRNQFELERALVDGGRVLSGEAPTV